MKISFVAFNVSATATATLSELMEEVEDLIEKGVRPVLCLDEFGEMGEYPQEFPRELFLTLRACGQRGMSILTAAPKRLSGSLCCSRAAIADNR